MATQIDRGAQRRAAPPILQNAFRPFFIGAALIAALMVPLWASQYLGFVSLLLPGGVSAHSHEMLYGFVAAIVCGFSLTAIPNWTGRSPVAGLPLAALFTLWLAGRSMLFWPESLIATGLDLAFLFVLAGVALREILAGKNWRNLPVTLILGAFALSHLAFHQPGLAVFAPRASLAVAAVLIGLIGGRITPSFTRNWMAGCNHPKTSAMPAPMLLLDKLSLGLLGLALAGWVVAPDSMIIGAGLLLAGALHLFRVSRWQGLSTLSEPLVWSLHAGMAWVGLGTILLGVGALWPVILPASAGLHAIAAGAIGTMALAVMTRVCLGHTGRARTAGGVETVIFALVHAGASLRVIAAITGNAVWPLILGAVLWSAAFALFAIVYTPMLFEPRVKG